MSTLFVCPVCGFNELWDPPYSASGGGSNEICWSCGYEYGWTDDSQGVDHRSYRQDWVAKGMPWWAGDRHPQPAGWNPEILLTRLLDNPGREGLT